MPSALRRHQRCVVDSPKIPDRGRNTTSPAFLRGRRETDRQTETDRDRDRQTDTETVRDRQTERDTDTDRKTLRQTETKRGRQTDGQTDRDRANGHWDNYLQY